MDISRESKTTIIGIVILILLMLLNTKGSLAFEKNANSLVGADIRNQIKFTKKEQAIITKGLDNFILHDYRKDPETLRDLSPTGFEEFTAYLFHRKGYVVVVTPQTRDGGKDITAKLITPLGETITYYIECKKYALNNRVGRPSVQKLVGVMTNKNVHLGMIITTSAFTKDTRNYINDGNHRIERRDFNDIIKMMS